MLRFEYLSLCGDDDAQAERTFRKALELARIEDKRMGVLECRVLLELLDFYDKRDRMEESKLVWQRVSDIVRHRYSDIVGKQGFLEMTESKKHPSVRQG